MPWGTWARYADRYCVAKLQKYFHTAKRKSVLLQNFVSVAPFNE
jgi:hypothetical protein